MFENYFKTAWRSLWKNKTFSFINVAGLAIGTAACLLILQYVNFELSYDQFNTNKDNLYRVVNDRYQRGRLVQHGTATYSGVGRAMKDDYPEVVNTARVEPYRVEVITHNDKKIGGQRVIAVDNSFLTMFSYPLLAGDPLSALKDPNNVIITESLARKFFTNPDHDWQSVLGSVMVFDRDSIPYKITGVCNDAPANSHLQFTALLSYVSLYSGSGNNRWSQADYDFTDSNFWVYIQLRPGTDHKALEGKLSAFSERHFQGSKISGSDEKFSLQPLSRAHLYSDFEYEIGKTGSATTVWGLLIIALFIIVIAWANYVNLTTAKSVERAKEVGIRKVAGATKGQLIRQFLSESFLINTVAMLIALGLVWSLQQVFNQWVEQPELSLCYLFKKGFAGYGISAGLIALMLAGIFVSGFYPAFVLSTFQPIKVLKGKFSASRKGAFLRKSLVTGQFALTVILIIGSMIVYRQMKFMNEQPLGVNIDQVLVIHPPVLSAWDSSYISKQNAFTAELKQLPHVKGAAASGRVPGSENELARVFDLHRTDSSTDSRFTVRFQGADQNFIDLYKIRLLAGRQFAPTDYHYNFDQLHTVVINKEASKLLGFSSPEDAIGKPVVANGKKWDIVGIVDDYHQRSLRYAIEPTLLIPAYESVYNSTSVKVDAAKLPATIAALKDKFAAFFPGNLFEYYFLDEKFNEQYKNDRLFGEVFGLFAGFGIFIACLGLLGLTLFATTQRTREIGIRKVLGASVSSIVLLISKDFIKLVLIAFLAASPVAWFVMHAWLQDFVYRIPISGWIFVLAGSLAVCIALATISFQAIRAALADPVRSLRSE